MGEIEACLQALPQVREAAVIAVAGPAGAQLVAYVVAREAGIDGQGLAAVLRQSLPDYMVPTHWVLLDALPLNNNGKLDRRALPAPDLNQPRAAYLAPQSLLQQQLAAIWQAVLQVEQVGLGDHFFERGGHSLLATQVVSRVRHELKRELPLRSVFEHPTLLGFAQACESLQAQDQCSHGGDGAWGADAAVVGPGASVVPLATGSAQCGVSRTDGVAFARPIECACA